MKLKGIEKKASILGLGTMIFAPSKKDLCFEIIENFTSNGGNYIDIGEIYGDPEEYGYAEKVLGMWLEETGKREQIVLVSKGLIPNTCKPIHPAGLAITPPHVHAAISGSLERLKTSYLDGWMFHRDDPSVAVGPLVDACNEEIERGRIKAYGGSNWSVQRIQEACDYAARNGLRPMTISSPHFSLAVAKEPYWPGATVVGAQDLAWYEKHDVTLVAWSSLGRGFFAKGSPDYTADPNLVRVYYNEANFARLDRATRLGAKKRLSRTEVALSYVLSQRFPTVALVGAASREETLSCLKAAETVLSPAEIAYLEYGS